MGKNKIICINKHWFLKYLLIVNICDVLKSFSSLAESVLSLWVVD